MPASVTEPLTQLLSWGLWLGSVYMIFQLLRMAPTVADEWRREARGRTTHKFAWWAVAAIVLASAGTIADVVLG